MFLVTRPHFLTTFTSDFDLQVWPTFWKSSLSHKASTIGWWLVSGRQRVITYTSTYLLATHLNNAHLLKYFNWLKTPNLHKHQLFSDSSFSVFFNNSSGSWSWNTTVTLSRMGFVLSRHRSHVTREFWEEVPVMHMLITLPSSCSLTVISGIIAVWSSSCKKFQEKLSEMYKIWTCLKLIRKLKNAL